ncbi:MAG: hypothetical protein EOM45_11265 [Clostridia bacterium]|nr:hypothetical protein [Clostridia bacterium]
MPQSRTRGWEAGFPRLHILVAAQQFQVLHYVLAQFHVYENLRQINLGLLSAHSSNVPLWYSELPGSMSDSLVLDHVLGSLEKLDVKDINLVESPENSGQQSVINGTPFR